MLIAYFFRLLHPGMYPPSDHADMYDDICKLQLSVCSWLALSTLPVQLQLVC